MRILPIIILAAGAFAAYVVFTTKPEPEKVEIKRNVPVVEIIEVHGEPYTLTISASGVVNASTTTELTAEVSGRILEVSSQFESGGFFKKGDLLLRIDASDYEAVLANAEASLADAKFDLSIEEAEAEQARREWEMLGEGKKASALTLRKPQVERAKAALKSAEVRVRQAKRDLKRTEVRAPYDGRVASAFADIGQHVGSVGVPLGNIYATDFAEVRLPITDRQASLMHLPVKYDGEDDVVEEVPVVLQLAFGDETYEWEGVVDRIEGSIDSETRLIHLVARIEDPYLRRQEGQPPLQIGMYAKAAVRGKTLEHAFVLPRIAMMEEDMVLIADPQNRLQLRRVKVAQSEGRNVIVTSGLSDGERVIITPLDYVVEGMTVNAFEAGMLKP